ncbi:MAG: beta-propeller domain-containing protein [Acidimicrobiales bacterium]
MGETAGAKGADMRRWWTMMLAATLCLALLPGVTAGPASGAEPVADACPPGEVDPVAFPDVGAGDTHAGSIACLSWWSIARGRSDGTYGPGLIVSRAQVASLVSRLVRTPGGRLTASPGNHFSDDDDSVHHYSINRLADAGVLAGRPGASFAPDEALTRGQMATVLVRAYELRSGRSLPADGDHFADDGASVHEDNVNKAAAAGLALGVRPGRFHPEAPVTRAQMASFLARTLRLVADAGALTDTPATLRLASNLRTDPDCDTLLGHLKENALDVVTAWGLPQSRGGGPIGIEPVPVESAPGAPQPIPAGDGEEGAGHSGTNVQEEGVDEPDVVKTDGQRLLTLVDGSLRALEVSGATPRLAGTLSLGDAGYFSELFLAGDRALLFGQTGQWPPSSVLALVDVADPGAMSVIDTLEVDGYVVSARMVDGTVRVVLSSHADGLELTYPVEGTPEAERDAEQGNRRLIEESAIDDWLPTYRRNGQPDQPYLSCGQLRRPPEFSGLGTLSVLTVDPATGLEPGAAAGVLATGEIVYASKTGLYVSTSRWEMWTGEADQELRSEVHAFDITAADAVGYVASGKVPGWLLNQFSMSEHDGVLRVATTSGAPWAGDTSESQVVTLAAQGDQLVELGRAGGLGRGESIFAVRFMGDVGYVVTFRRTDPLYVVDLADPVNPAVVGELKINGYSAYLHPIGEGLLLGVGQDATEEGVATGTQLSVFDVSDPAVPRRVHQTTLEGGSSEVEFDHRAFLHWPATGLTVVPYSRWSDQSPFVGAVGFDVDAAAGITEVGRVSHPPYSDGSFSWAPPIRRSVVVGDRLYTVSDRGVRASDLHSLADREWVGFGE